MKLVPGAAFRVIVAGPLGDQKHQEIAEVHPRIDCRAGRHCLG
jgi:hypothetical protein